MTEDLRAKWTAEGRGTGSGASYKTWLKTTDVNSRGNRHRKRERIHARICNWMSDVEYDIAKAYQCSAYVTELLDQFPLPLDLTRRVARELAVDHPRDPTTGVDINITTDIVLKVIGQKGEVVAPRSVKPEKDLVVFNQLEHAEIERRAWLEMGGELKFASNSPECLSPALLANANELELHAWMHQDIQPYQGYMEDMSAHLLRAIVSARHSKPLLQQCLDVDHQTGQPEGSTLKVAYHLIGRHEIRVDLAGAPMREQNILDIQSLTLAWHNDTGALRGAA